MRKWVLLMACFAAFACADAYDPLLDDKNVEEATLELRDAGTHRLLDVAPWNENEPPETLNDVNGWIWVRSHKIEYSDAEIVAPNPDEEIDERDLSPEPNPFDANDYEYGYYFRPLADIGGWEYHLDATSIEKLGAKMRYRAIARLEGREDIPGLYEGKDSPTGFGERAAGEGLGTRLSEYVNPATHAKIIGTDDRIPFSAWAGVYPVSTHAAYIRPPRANYPVGSSACTAFKAGNHFSAATAAHCVYESDNNTWRTRLDIQFKAGLLEANPSEAPPAVPSACYTRVISANYGSHPNLAKNDYAVLIFNGNGTSWCHENTYDFGYVGWKSVSVGANFESFLFGYPFIDQSMPAFWPNALATSYSSMTDGIGQTIFQPNVVRHKHDSTGGQSGTALLSYSSSGGYQARAIHKGGGAGNYNRGREFNGTVKDWINSFIGE